MLSYDKNTNMLTLEKVHNPDMGVHFCLLQDLQESYNKFVNDGVYDALKTINTNLGIEGDTNKELQFYGVEVEGTNDDEPHIQVRCYPAHLSKDKSIKVIDLPYMDSLGRLHFGKTVKTFINKLTSSDNVSFDMDNKVLSLVLAERTVKVMADGIKSKVYAKGINSTKIPLASLASFISYLDGEEINAWDIIHNPILMDSLESVPRIKEHLPIYYEQQIAVDSDIHDKKQGTFLVENLRENPDYLVTSIRPSINRAVSIDRALGETLSRPVLSYPAGSYVTPALIQELKHNRVNCIYIKTLVPASASKLSRGMINKELIFTQICSGWIVTKYLHDRFEHLEIGDVIESGFGIPPALLDDFSFKGVKASAEVLEFLESTGEPGVYLGNQYKPWYFETEILGNYTLQYRDVYSDMECKEKHVSPFEWFNYKKENVTESPEYRRDRLYGDDLLALLSAIGYTLLRGKSVFLDRDKDFLKKVETPEIALPRELKAAIRTHINTYRSNIRAYVNGTRAINENTVFSKLTSTFRKQLYSKKLIDTCDVTNYAAEISQALHVSVDMQEPPEVVRQISTPYYGRLCPFETPEGKKIGLVNTKALGCRIVNGNMLSTVRRVLHNNGSITVSDEIEMLSVDQELQYRISDIMELVPSDKAGEYLNTRIKAKVPNPSRTGDRQIFAEIMSEDLDYVYAHTEGFISPTASLIPFACTDDAVRVSFGSKLIKQAIYLLDPDKPRVQTSMYRNIFKASNTYLLVAERDGEVVSLDLGEITIRYDGDADETVYRVEEFRVATERVICMRYHIRTGDRVTAGQVLADSSASQDGIFSPGKNLLAAYMSTGYNYEDAIHTSMAASVKLTSPSAKYVRKRVKSGYTFDRSGMYKYYKEGEKITTITYNDKGRTVSHDVISTVSGIWYSTDLVGTNDSRELHFNILGYRKLGPGDKLSGRHGNKGVDSIVDDNSRMPMLPNGLQVDILLNPMGLPSRMNTGQIMEAHLGLVATVLDIYINSDAFNGATLEEVKMLMKLTHELANCGSQEASRGVMERYKLPDDLQETIYNNMPKILDWADTFDENGDCRLYNPVTCEWFPYKITIGVPTILKMKQERETKIHGRGGPLEEEYMMVSGQPTSGGARGGGQALGGMETWAIQAYGVSEFTHDMCTVNSDDEVARTNKLLDAFDSSKHIDDTYSSSRAVTNFIYCMEALGLNLVDDDGLLPNVDNAISDARYIYDIPKLINEGELHDSSDDIDSAVDSLMREIWG